MAKILEIRNSTAEFLTFLAANQEEGVQVVYKDENIWATQAAMISRHIKGIYSDGELSKDMTCAKIARVVK